MAFSRTDIWTLCDDYSQAMTSQKGVGVEEMNRKLDDFFDTATSSELDLFPACWNWDSGNDRIKQLVTHPNCDAATALRTYWLFRPHYYLQFAVADDVPSYQRDDFDLMMLIEQSYLDGAFENSKISYRPRRKPKTPNPTWVREIPVRMYEPVGPQPIWHRIIARIVG